MITENGIYFGIPFEEYDAIERLSKTRLKQILVSPADFWAESWLNPNPKRLTPQQEKTRKLALLLGGAYHCARLESHAFHDRYVREISQADFADREGFLGTGTAIEAELARRELPKKSKDDDGVLGQARRLAEAGYEGTIWHIEQAAWEADKGDRIVIPAEKFDQIVVDMERMRKIADIDAALSGGEAEVVILYDCPDTGLPMKARLDFLRGDGWVELKSFGNPNRKPLEQCLLDAIRFNGYYIDVAAYHEAVEMIRAGRLSLQGDYTAEQYDLVDQIVCADHPLPHKLIFQQKDGVPNVLSRSLKLFENPHAVVDDLRADGATEDRIDRAEKFAEQATVQPTLLMMKARGQIKRAKTLFQRYSEIYPRGEPWQPWDAHREVDDLDFHPSWLESI